MLPTPSRHGSSSLLTPSVSSPSLSPSSSPLSSSSSSSSLLSRQTLALRQMLKLESSESSSPWKLLILDRVGQDILAPILNIKALREEGVTLHLLLHNERQPVPEVPAVYFCLPSTANVDRIGEDLSSRLYGSYHFNFITPIGREQLEKLAQLAVNNQVVAQVKRVYDQYLNFIALESNLFTLCNNQQTVDLSYYALNRTAITDTQMELIINQIVEGLFSVCVTLGTIPIIRCPSGNAAEAVALKLDKKLRDNIRDTRNSLFSSDTLQAGQYSFYRPLLILLDRQFDLATPLHHTWTYQALAHDVLHYSLNRIELSDGSESGGGKAMSSKADGGRRYCDLDSSDSFWVEQKGSPFPLVAEKIQDELEEYRAKEEDIKRMKHEMGVDNAESDEAIGMISDNTQKLTSAVSSLPALLEKKRLLDMHTSIATAILEQIKRRHLDVYFELEEKLMSKQQHSVQDKKSLMDTLKDDESGSLDDKLRLLLILYLCMDDVSNEEFEQMVSDLESKGCETSSLAYLRRWRSVTQLGAHAKSSDYTGGGTSTASMFTKLMSQGSQFVMEGVKNLVVKRHKLPLTKLTQELMEVRQGVYQDSYRYFDPKMLRGGADVPRQKNPFQDAIVFVVGGGNYIEYQNLLEFANSSNVGNLNNSSSGANLVQAVTGSNNSGSKRIIYGCTSVVNAQQMLEQLAQLGRELA